MSIEHYLTSAPPWSLCNLFKAGATDTWERIRFSRTIPNLKIHETTITQNLIYELKILQAVGGVRNLRIQESENEKTNGSDIELCLVTNGQAICYALQAKIIYHASKKSHGNGDYRQMHHMIKSTGDYQIDLLLNYGTSKGKVPLYLLYNYVNNPLFLPAAGLKHFGCTLINARFLKDNWQDTTGNLRKDIKFFNLHASARTTTKPAFPWHELVCGGWPTTIANVLSRLGLDAKTVVTPLSIDELLEDDAFTEITTGLTLTPKQEGKAKRNREREIEGLPTFNPKFRIIADVSDVNNENS